jgi:hypothetical protein
MNSKKFKIEYLLYGVAFVIGLFIRMYRLGDFPLNGTEAQWALMAFEHLGNTPLVVGSQPGYILFTSLLFNVFNSSNFLARFIPAAVGSILVFSPVFFKKYISSFSALVLAFGLALDPALIAISRNAGGGAIALTFLVFFIGFMLNGNAVGSGICLGLAMMGGPDFWHGILIISIAWVLNFIVIGKGARLGETLAIFSPIFRSMKFILSLAITVLLISSLFFTQPQVLGGVFSSIAAYLDQWINPSANHSNPIQTIIIFLFYEIFPFSFAMIGLFWIYFRKLHDYVFFTVCFLASIVISLAYPERNGISLVWSVIPLWIIAAYTIEHLYSLAKKQSANYYLFSGIIVVLLLFSVLNLLSMMTSDPGSVDFQLRFAIIAGTFIVIGLLGILLTWGWSVELAYSSILTGIMMLLFLYSFSAGWRSARLGSNADAELWFPDANFLDADLLQDSISQVSGLNTGDSKISDVAILEPASPVVKWILRNQEDVIYLNFLPKSISPDMVITKDADFPGLAASYTGQDFVFINSPQTQLYSIMDWLRWAIYRKTTSEKTYAYLWVKSDIFPGSISSSEQNFSD